ncbi:LeuA family protein [Rhodococcus erythropolis]|uniref:LeuA family protein n=1 Tax=Rhodococcus erythropolis TaxID=1833 RepID=UPI001E49590D|nr:MULTISPECIES: LeuA family protein [Rhodococcus erythropolis group]MCD2104426.1 LeuA family protein [Rhodococcus qingshengii]MCZ4523480.1 LeuA family protein [Rhodococcus erythropolis]
MTDAEQFPDRPRRELPKISDATLRDTAHMAGVEFGPAEAATIAGLLKDTGVDLVEVGMISGPDARDADIIQAAHAEIGPDRCLSLVVVRDRAQVSRAFDEAQRLGCQSILLSIPTSTEHAGLKLASPSTKYLIALARFAIEEGKRRGLLIEFSGEDGVRTDPERLVEYVSAGFDAGADRFRLAETVACARPAEVGDIVASLVAIEGSEIEIHSHNMLGLAVANSLAAYEAGAQWISATVGGIGERGGNAPLAEILVALRLFHGESDHDLSTLTELSRYTLATENTGFAGSFMSGPTSEYAYAYELSGQLEHPAAYETIAAETVGNVRKLSVRSRLSASLVNWVADTVDGIGPLSPNDTDAVLADLSRDPHRPKTFIDIEAAVSAQFTSIRNGV